MASIIINCSTVRCKTGDYHGVWYSRAEYFQLSFLSLCSRELGWLPETDVPRLFITEAQIRFPFARNREMTVEVIRTYQDVAPVAEIERYSWRAWQADGKKKRVSRLRTSSKGFRKENCLLLFVSFRSDIMYGRSL